MKFTRYLSVRVRISQVRHTCKAADNYPKTQLNFAVSACLLHIVVNTQDDICFSLWHTVFLISWPKHGPLRRRQHTMEGDQNNGRETKSLSSIPSNRSSGPRQMKQCWGISLKCAMNQEGLIRHCSYVKSPCMFSHLGKTDTGAMEKHCWTQ